MNNDFELWWRGEDQECKRFYELVRQDEREACAKLCESYVGATFDMCAI